MKFTAIVTILQLVAFSALATDCLQTQHWINGTRDNPVVSPLGIGVAEGNPVLAGKAHLREPYFKGFAFAVEAAPKMLSPPLALAYVGYVAVGGTRTVVRNNRTCRGVGFPEYFMLAWRWSW
jgi:hypothetical protein